MGEKGRKGKGGKEGRKGGEEKKKEKGFTSEIWENLVSCEGIEAGGTGLPVLQVLGDAKVAEGLKTHK